MCKLGLTGTGSGPQRGSAHMSVALCVYQIASHFYSARQASTSVLETSPRRAAFVHFASKYRNVMKALDKSGVYLWQV